MHLCQQLASHGHEVHLLTSTGAQSTGEVRLHNIVRSWGWSALPKIIRVIRQVKPDAVMLMYVGWIYKKHPMPTLLQTVVRRLDKNIERVTMVSNALGSDTPEKLRGRIMWRIASLLAGGANDEFGTLLRDSQRIAILSEHHLKRLIEIDPAVAAKSVLVPPPPILHLSPDTPEVRAKARARFGIADDEIVFTFFGYGYPGKGIETFIAAFALLADRMPKLKIMFAGRIDFAPAVDGRPYKTVLLEPAEPWKSRVIVSEYDATSDEGSTFLRAADVCVLPFDGGVALNNSSVAGSSVHGLPIISTTRPDLESAFVDGENMLLIPPKSPEILAVAMERLAGDPALRAKLSAGAEKLAREWFSWDRTLAMLFSESINDRAKSSEENLPQMGQQSF
jgi:glycosyltransferase involved in cell wall biosynthesis